MLRSFSYLDTDVVDDFLAQLGAEPPDAPAPAARFARLVEVLRDRAELTYLATADEPRWDELMRGDLVEAEVVVRRVGPGTAAATGPGGLGALGALGGIGAADGVAGVLEAVGRLAPAVSGLGSGLGLDEPARSLARAFSSATAPARLGGATWAIAELAAAPAFRFAAELRHGQVRRGLDDLDGEATIVGKVRRFVAAGDPAPAPGAAPAVVLTPVAVFR